MFLINSHKRRDPYEVNLEYGTCTCKYFRNDTGFVCRRCVHMFAAELVVRDEALPLRMRALHHQLEALKARLTRRVIRHGRDVVLELRQRGLSVVADAMQRIIDEIQSAEEIHAEMYEDRHAVLTAFNAF
ncbi:MAG: hypothetical protein AAB393_19755 [Bacteroidota bacterium]